MTKSTSDSGDTSDKPYRLNPLWHVYDKVMSEVDHHIGWFKLPKPLGLLDLIGIGNTLREQNLYDTSREPSVNAPEAPTHDPKFDTERSFDGSWNDLAHPDMGMAETRFGRNVPLTATWPDKANILEPNPRVVSRRLMTRDEVIPARAGNALIATWLQFMIRDGSSTGPAPATTPGSCPSNPMTTGRRHR
jgi:hypothetical protein